MCLAIPGRIVELTEAAAPFTSAIVEFGGARRSVSLSCVPSATVGDYVMVHAGIAISLVDEEEAAKVLQALEQLDLEDEDQLTSGDVFQSQACDP